MTIGTRFDAWSRAIRSPMVSIVRRYGFLNWTFADQGLVSASNLFTTILLARFLGLEEFGRFTLAWTVVQITSTLHHSLVISPMVSIGPKQSASERPAYMGAVVLYHAAFAAILFVLTLLGALAVDLFFPSWNASRLALPLACFSLATNVHEFLRRYFFTKGFLSLAFKIDAVRYSLQIALLFGIVKLTDFDAPTGLWLMGASAFIGFACYVRHMERLAWNSDIARRCLERHWRFSSWLSLGLSMDMILDYVYFVVAGALLGAAAVGAANATRSLLGVSRIVNAGLENIAPARAAERFHQGGVHALVRYLTGLTTVITVMTAGVTLAIALLPEFWLRLAFGEEYAGYDNLVWWWAAIHFLYAAMVLLNTALFAIERTKAMFVASVLSSAAGIAGAYAIVTMFGLNGMLAGIFAMSLIRVGVLAIALFRQIAQLRHETPTVRGPS